VNKQNLTEKIASLKKSRDVIILAHNYQIGDIQDIADFVGDSLDLSIKASQVEEPVILFCGVHFMAETAAILSPEKTVLIPDARAGCPMADMITAEEMRTWKAAHPDSASVCYVNTSAEVKAECDVCCTSSNALQIVAGLKENKILFAPDKNLANFVARNTSKTIIPWDGYCYVHNNIHPEHVLEKKALYPAAEVWVHPECRPEVIDLADKTLSTGGMVREAKASTLKDIIIGTEAGIIHRLQKENPGKRFNPVKDTALCKNMKKITLEKVYNALQNMEHNVVVPAETAEKARSAIEKMING